MSQTERILDYLQQNGSITQRDADEHFGCTRLGARIWELRSAGFPIVSRMENGVNRFGERTRYARYSLEAKRGT